MNWEMFDAIMNVGLSGLLAYAIAQISRLSNEVMRLQREKDLYVAFKHNIDLTMKAALVRMEALPDVPINTQMQMNDDFVDHEHFDDVIRQNHEFLLHLQSASADEDLKK